jgi:glycosyltransferase involved in cell wall biosynthesis
MSVQKPIKIGIVTGHPTQWESPFYGLLSKSGVVSPSVYYGSKLGIETEIEAESKIALRFDMPGMMEGYEHHFFLPGNKQRQQFCEAAHRAELNAIIVEGHDQSLQQAAIQWATRRGVPLIYRSDSTLLYQQPYWKRLAKSLQRPAFFKKFAAFLPLSTPAAIYLKHYGVKEHKIFISTYMVHNHWYWEQASNWRHLREKVKLELGVERYQKVVLGILRFEERENPFEFLEVAKKLRSQRKDIGFILVGDGTQRSKVFEYVKAHQLNNVVLPGMVPISHLPKYYAVSDVFVHPAKEECWGLSVNEAMACRVPVVVSDKVGSRYDLIPSEQFGKVYPCGDAAVLTRELLSLIDDEELSHSVADAAWIHLHKYSYATALITFERAVQYAVSAVAPSAIPAK